MRKGSATVCVMLVLLASALLAQRAATPAEIKQAQSEIPRLVEVLQLTPGMTVADVGAGFGAMTIVMSGWLGPTGRVYATDIAAPQLAALIVGTPSSAAYLFRRNRRAAEQALHPTGPSECSVDSMRS